MTAKLFSRTVTRRPAQAILALLIGALPIGSGASTTAFAAELKAPAGKSRLLRDNDITIIIIDEDDDKRSTSRIGTPSTSKSSPVRQPSARINRDDNDLTIRFKRDRSARSGSGNAPSIRSGPKVIIVDKNSFGCDGGSVCVIRP